MTQIQQQRRSQSLDHSDTMEQRVALRAVPEDARALHSVDEPKRLDLLRLTRALGALPDNERHALILRECRGFSSAEIARRLGTAEWAVGMLLASAHRNLAANEARLAAGHAPQRRTTAGDARTFRAAPIAVPAV